MDEYGAKLKNYQNLLAMTEQRVSESNLISQLGSGDGRICTVAVDQLRMRRKQLVRIVLASWLSVSI